MDLFLTTLKDAISIIADLIGIIALLVSILKPEKKWTRIFAVVGIFLIATTVVWNTLNLSSSKRTARAIEAKTYRELSHQTSQFLYWISQMILYASDGWIPTNETDFFSRRSVDLICRELNAYELPIIEPRITWSQLFADETQKFRNFLVDIRKREGSRIEPYLIQTILDLEESLFLTGPKHWDTARRLLPRQYTFYLPYLCEIITDTIEKNFDVIRQLVDGIRRGERSLGLTTLKFQLPSYSMGNLGIHRINSSLTGEITRISFYTYAHGWILHGNEFVTLNIQAILSLPFSNNHCKNVRAAILDGSLTGVLPAKLHFCNHVTVAFFFGEPVKEVTLYFRGLYFPYTLTAYGIDGTRISSIREAVSSSDYSDHRISVASRSADISWVEFGNKVTSTLIRAIEFRR